MSKVEWQQDTGRGWSRTVDMFKYTITSKPVSAFESNAGSTSRSLLVLVIDVECLDGTGHHGANMSCLCLGSSR